MAKLLEDRRLRGLLGVAILLLGAILCCHLTLFNGRVGDGFLVYVLSNFLGCILVIASVRHRMPMLIPGLLWFCCGVGYSAIWFYGYFTNVIVGDAFPFTLAPCYCVALVLLGLFMMAASAFDRFVSGPPTPPGHCTKCGYNLTGLTEPRCPECGTPFDSSASQSQISRPTQSDQSGKSLVQPPAVDRER